MDLGVGQDDPRLGRVLDRELGPSVLPGDAAYGPGQMVALQGFDILDLKGVEEEIVQPEHGQGVVHVEAEDEGLDKVRGLLDVGNVLRLGASLDLHVTGFQVEANSAARRTK